MSSHPDGNDYPPAVDGSTASPTASGVGETAALGSGADATQAGEDSHSLPMGTRLHEFELVRHIGDGGFSVVYLALDHSLDRQVALKEYMPGPLATRVGRLRVSSRSERHRETFDIGLRSFMNEAKLLAQFDHPSLVKVFRFWEANGTAYMAMPFYRGSTLKETIRAMPTPPDEAWLLGMLGPLTDALEMIHGVQCYHRDIAPDNVILLNDSPVHPLLLDFGAARRVIGDLTQALTVILKPGYAPVEQYAEVPGMRQGPWTDVYALAAVVYWAIMGRTPPPSVGRMMRDSHVPLATCAAGRYSPAFLEAVDRALVVAPEDRTQSIAAFRDAIGLGPDAVPRKQGRTIPGLDPDATVIGAPGAALAARRAAEQRSTSTATKALSAVPSAKIAAVRSAETAAPQRTRSRGITWAAGASLGIGLIAAAAWWALRSPEPVAPAPEAARRAEPTSPVASAPAASAGASGAQAGTVQPEARTAPHASPDVGTVLPEKAATRPPVPSAAIPAQTTTSRNERAPVVRTPVKPERSGSRGNADAPAPAAKTESAARNAECAQIFQRLSLGENRPDLLERATALKCR